MSRNKTFSVLLTLLITATLMLSACQPQPAAAPEQVIVTQVIEKTVEVPVEKIVEVEKTVEVVKDDTITIEYWQYFFDARVDAMNRLIQQFEAANPDVQVIHNSDIPYAEFPDKIAATAPAGVGPDVVSLFYGWIPAWVDAGYLIPLPADQFPEEMIKEQFAPMVLDSKFQDQYWALPTAVRTLALFWNKDLFTAAGLDPESPPKTLDEFLDYAQKLTQVDAQGNILVEGFPPEMPGQAHHWFREILLRQYGGVPYSPDNKTVSWNSPEGCQAFTYLSDFETIYKTGSNDLYDGSTQAFLQGKVGLHIDGSFRIGSIKANAPNLNYGVAELPTGPNGEMHNFGSYWTHGITKKAAEDPRRLDAAIRFMKFITTAEAGTLWVGKTGELPAQLTAASDEALISDPIMGPFAAALSYSHATFFVDETQQRQFLIDAYDAIRLTSADPCQALNDAAVLEQELLDQFWANH
jgi:multiple sugar transport system substrate-binding protein